MAELHVISNVQGAWQHEDGDGTVTVRMKDGEEPTYESVCFLLVKAFIALMTEAMENEE